MTRNLETPFAPVLEPNDPASLPLTIARGSPVFAPLLPRRRDRVDGRRWLRRVAEARPLWGHFCVSDLTLRRLESIDPLGLRLAAAAGATGVVTMDVPLYGFMTQGQRRRAEMMHRHRLLASVEQAPRLGLDVVPLVKALDDEAVAEQLDLVHELGLGQAAMYVREFLLEGDERPIRRFVRGAHRRRIHPLLLGAFSGGALQWGPASLAARHHYVLARKGLVLRARGPARPVDGAEYSDHARRFLTRGDRAGLCAHNYAIALDRIRPGRFAHMGA